MTRQIALGLIAGLLVAGCGRAAAAGRQIDVQAGSGGGKMFFLPGQVTVGPGEPILFAVRNTDPIDHEFESDDLRINELTIPAGASRKVPVTAPAQPGRYDVYCDLPGHKEAGRVMHVDVR